MKFFIVACLKEYQEEVTKIFKQAVFMCSAPPM